MQETILIVDDSPTVVFAVEQELHVHGYRTVSAGRLAEVLEKARAERVDAVLLDVVLPDGSGLDVLEELKESQSSPAVVVITGQGSESTAVRAMRSGADDYITKPVDSEELDRVLSEALNGRRRELGEQEKAHEIAEDLSLAESVQRKLEQSELPEIPGWEIAARLVPARTIGGDIYGAVQSDGYLNLWVGDISGKGIGAALLSASVRTVIRNHVKAGVDPGETVGQVARLVHADLASSNSFLTLFFSSIELAAGRIDVIDAGHAHARIRRADGRWEEIDGACGLPIGVEREPAYRSVSETLEPGDCMVLFTDGLVELGEHPDCSAGIQQLESTIDGTVESGVERIQEAVFDVVEEEPQTDDRTLVLARRCP